MLQDREEIKKIFRNIYGDKNRYLQILLNFLSNSIKFTPEGKEITVQLVLID